MKKLALIAFIGVSATAFCVNQGHSQFTKVNAVSAYAAADTTPMKTTKMHKMHKSMKAKKDSTQS